MCSSRTWWHPPTRPRSGSPRAVWTARPASSSTRSRGRYPHALVLLARQMGRRGMTLSRLCDEARADLLRVLADPLAADDEQDRMQKAEVSYGPPTLKTVQTLKGELAGRSPEDLPGTAEERAAFGRVARHRTGSRLRRLIDRDPPLAPGNERFPHAFRSEGSCVAAGRAGRAGAARASRRGRTGALPQDLRERALRSRRARIGAKGPTRRPSRYAAASPLPTRRPTSPMSP